MRGQVVKSIYVPLWRELADEKCNDDEIIFIVKDGSKYGLYSQDGEIILAPEYDNIIAASCAGTFILVREGKIGIACADVQSYSFGCRTISLEVCAYDSIEEMEYNCFKLTRYLENKALYRIYCPIKKFISDWCSQCYSYDRYVVTVAENHYNVIDALCGDCILTDNRFTYWYSLCTAGGLIVVDIPQDDNGDRCRLRFLGEHCDVKNEIYVCGEIYAIHNPLVLHGYDYAKTVVSALLIDAGNSYSLFSDDGEAIHNEDYEEIDMKITFCGKSKRRKERFEMEKHFWPND